MFRLVETLIRLLAPRFERPEREARTVAITRRAISVRRQHERAMRLAKLGEAYRDVDLRP